MTESSSTNSPGPFLTEKEQTLLKAALLSNKSPNQPIISAKRPAVPASDNRQGSSHRHSLGNMGSYSTDMYRSPDEGTPVSGQFDGLGTDTSPLFDFDLEDSSFDWDNSGMIGDLPAISSGENAEQHEKRKMSTDDEEGDEASGKRRDSEEKGSARKPGRKPLTGEPTTVSWHLREDNLRDTDNPSTRNARPRIERRSAHSASGKSAISRS